MVRMCSPDKPVDDLRCRFPDFRDRYEAVPKRVDHADGSGVGTVIDADVSPGLPSMIHAGFNPHIGRRVGCCHSLNRLRPGREENAPSPLRGGDVRHEIPRHGGIGNRHRPAREKRRDLVDVGNSQPIDRHVENRRLHFLR